MCVEGRKEVLVKGHEINLNKGLEKARNLLIRQLVLRFGDLSSDVKLAQPLGAPTY